MKKLITALTAVLACFSLIGFAAGHASAAADDAAPVITLGTSLTSSQEKGTLNVLKGALSDSSSYNTLTVTGSDLVIGFSGAYLLEILSSLPTENVIIKLADPSRPGLFTPEENEENTDLIMLLMVMRVTE